MRDTLGVARAELTCCLHILSVMNMLQVIGHERFLPWISFSNSLFPFSWIPVCSFHEWKRLSRLVFLCSSLKPDESQDITKHEIVFQPFCFYCIIYRCAHTPISCLIHLDITFLNHGEWGAASKLPCQAPNNLIWAHFLLSWVLLEAVQQLNHTKSKTLQSNSLTAYSVCLYV